MTTLFDLPIAPEEFGVVLPSSNLRRLDFSGLDYTTARRAIIEYIRTYFPDDFNDFVASNGIMMLVEILAATTAKLSLRADLLAGEGFLNTAQREESVVNHLALINQRIRRQTPATVDIEASVENPVFTDTEIDPGTSFSFTGVDGNPVNYEIFRAPGDFTSKIIIPAGKRGVIVYGIEGRFASPVVVTSPGGPDQRFTIEEADILESPIFVTVTAGSEIQEWAVVTEPIERFGPNDRVVEVNFIGDSAVFRFGDDVTGAAPLSGQSIQFRFRTGGGVRGRIGVGQIDATRPVTPLPPVNASTVVRFRNVVPSTGGTDRESLERAKKRAPRDFAVRNSIVTAGDYAQVATTYSHPVFGSVSKAVATIRTGLNANRVELYVLAEGPDNIPVAPSAGLKRGLETFVSDLNVLTDSAVVLDGSIKLVDIDLTVVINRNADATVVKEKVESALTNYFAATNWEMGRPLFVSNLVETIEAIDGIAYIDLFQPANNILQTNELADTGSEGVGFNELIAEGKRDTRYFYERAQRQ